MVHQTWFQLIKDTRLNDMCRASLLAIKARMLQIEHGDRDASEMAALEARANILASEGCRDV